MTSMGAENPSGSAENTLLRAGGATVHCSKYTRKAYARLSQLPPIAIVTAWLAHCAQRQGGTWQGSEAHTHTPVSCSPPDCYWSCRSCRISTYNWASATDSVTQVASGSRSC